MKRNRTNQSRKSVLGMTLMEVTLALALAMSVAAATVLMAGQQVALMRLLSDFAFLRDEAPSINTLLGRIIQKSDSYRVFPDRGSVFAGSGAVNTGGTALWLRFRNPDGTFQQSALVFETISGESGLNYYNHDGTTWSPTPDWTV